MVIPWYLKDPRFAPGTVADVGDVRLTLGRTHRERNNKWRLYLEVRTRKKHGVADDLKRGVCVAQFDGNLSLDQVQEKAAEYFVGFVLSMASALEI